MIIGALKETNLIETRTPLSPDTTNLLTQKGFKIYAQKSIGEKSTFTDKQYRLQGAEIKQTALAVLSKSDILIKISPLTIPEILQTKNNTIIISQTPLISPAYIKIIKEKNLTYYALDKLPRISRAQSFDILTSQNNLAGYQAIIKAASLTDKMIPLSFTAAGSVPPLKFLIIGIGIAGLQAIATAKRLGGKIYAFDSNPATKEQALSLGATFVENLDIIRDCDIIISSAFSPNKKPPLIINEKILKSLKPHTVLIDMATHIGNNIQFSKNAQIVVYNNLTIYGGGNLANQIPYTASTLLANNFANFINYIIPDSSQKSLPDINDEIISSTLIVKG